ncbi:MAG: hypothetical protein AAF085_02300 [Planctomycetota bacterium]
MTLALFIVGALLSVTSIAMFLLGSFGVSFYAIRRRLPVRSPIDFMHWGSTGFFLGNMLIICGLVLY